MKKKFLRQFRRRGSALCSYTIIRDSINRLNLIILTETLLSLMFSGTPCTQSKKSVCYIIFDVGYLTYIKIYRTQQRGGVRATSFPRLSHILHTFLVRATSKCSSFIFYFLNVPFSVVKTFFKNPVTLWHKIWKDLYIIIISEWFDLLILTYDVIQNFVLK